MGEIQTFLGMLYIVEDLLNKGLLQYDPNNKNNMLVYHSAGTTSPEGWYSENIQSAVSDLFNTPDDRLYIINFARENNIDTEKHFANANAILR